MSLLRTIASGLRSIFRKEQVERETDEELCSFFEMAVEEKMKRGTSRPEAARAVRLERGSLDVTKEIVRTAGWEWFVETCWQDLRFAYRMLRKSPGFTAVAVVTLALGIGANTAMFGVVDSALLHTLPFRDIERLVNVWTTDAGGDTHSPLPDQYLALRKYSQAFEQVASAGWVDNFYGSDESGWQNLRGLLVSSNWLPTLGFQPLLGRNFREDEQIAGRDAVVILSFGCWHTSFRRDPTIVGKQILLNRRPVTIVGVMPQSLAAYDESIEVYAPLVLESYASTSTLRVANTARVRIVARLKPGATLDQARSETESIARSLKGATASTDRSGHLLVEGFSEVLRHPGPTKRNAQFGLWMTAVAAGVVLLIACTNVASLLLARGVNRCREVAVRSALGCSRGRMIRQLLTESMLLFLAGGSLGLLAARSSQEVITKIASGIVWDKMIVEINPRILLMSLGISLLSALFFGMIPALHATRVNLNGSLKDALPSTTSGVRVRRPRNLLVIFQVALGMVLLVGFGLLFRSLLYVESSPLGFDPHHVLTAGVSLPASRYSDPSAKADVMRKVLEQVRSMPGVESASIVDSLPMDGADSARLSIKSDSSVAMLDETWFLSVGADYFSTLKIPMLAGRPFRETDVREALPVAIINQTFAKRYFPGTNPIGSLLAFADLPTTWREIVGVVSDFRQRNPEEDLRPLVYLPVAQTLPGRWSMAIRLRPASELGNFSTSFGKQLQPVDPGLYWKLGSMQAQIHDSESLTLRRPIIILLASFGSLALILVIVGVFGVTSYSVAERTREIGIRTALGATRLEIASLVLRESMSITFAGLAVGALCAYAMSRFFPTEGIGWSGSGIFLYGISRTDGLTYGLAATLLTSVVLAASWVPARRAMRVDPMVALRYE